MGSQSESNDQNKLHDRLVDACYQAVLNRTADRQALEAHARLFRDRPLDEAVRRTIQGLVSSAEFARRWTQLRNGNPEYNRTSISTSDIEVQMLIFNEEEMLSYSLAPLVDHFPKMTILDMGSTDRSLDIVCDIFKSRAEVVKYDRMFLTQYGYASARNFLSGFAKLPWVLAIDADEVLTHGITDGHISIGSPQAVTRVATIERQNFRPDGWTIDQAITADNSKLSSIEVKRRLYRPAAGQRWEGYIHEELYGADIEMASSHSSITLNHYSIFRATSKLQERHLMYSWMLLKVFNNPELQKGVNRFWYEKYVVENMLQITEEATRFETAGGFGRIA